MRAALAISGLAAAALAIGCGGDGPDRGPRPLVPDPAVETGCRPGPVAGARAKPVACVEELIGGRLAAGRVGDLVLENARLRVIVRGGAEGHYLLGSGGGGIVDAAVVGGEDLVKEIMPVVDLAGGGSDELVIVEAGDDGPAEVVVRGPARALDLVRGALGREAPPVIVEHHYRLAAGADAVELETHVFTIDGAEVTSHDIYDALFFGGRAPAFLPGRGWVSGQGTAEVIATGGTTTSYGLVYPPDAPDPQLVDLAGVRIALGPTVTEGSARRWLVLGDGSVASVTERAWALRGVALGEVRGTTAPGVDVVVRAAGAPLTVARADAAGAFRAAVPPGAYTLAAESAGRVPGAEVAVTVTAGAAATATVPAGAGGELAIAVRDDTGAPLPARVIAEGGGEARLAWVGAAGELVLPLPPGTWRVSVSRGLEYDAFVAAAVTVDDGQRTPVAVTLTRVVDTAGWISLDTHLHSELSTDSTFPVDDRLRAVAAEGVELPVSSDHDVIVDYGPIIAELGLDAWLGGLTGTEASSLSWGHLNGWPLVPDEARAGRGSPRWLGRTPGDVFAALRAAGAGGGGAIVQANHPRFGSSALFDAIDLDPSTLTARRDPTDLGLPPDADLSDLGFDAVEVANALSDEDFEEVFADWMAMVAAGHPAAATGSSDSHGPSAFAGEARTYVWVGAGADDPATVSADLVVDAIRARHVVVGTGAFVTAGIVSGAATSLPGDSVDVTGMAQVTLHVTVQAPPWQPLARIRVYQGGAEVRTIVLDPGDTAVLRHDADVVLPPPPADTFYVVRVDAAGRGDPVLGTPMPAFTNPILARVGP